MFFNQNAHEYPATRGTLELHSTDPRLKWQLVARGDALALASCSDDGRRIGAEFFRLLIPDSRKVVPPSDLIDELSTAEGMLGFKIFEPDLNQLVERLLHQGIPAIKDSFLYIQPSDPEVIDESRLRDKLTKIAEWYSGEKGAVSSRASRESTCPSQEGKCGGSREELSRVA